MLGKAIRRLGAKAHPCVVDVSVPADIEAAVSSSVAAFGVPNTLVNNAGISGPHAPTWELSLADWQRVFDVNMTGTFLCCKALIPHLMALPWSRIVNLSSIAAKDGNAMISAYAASKAAVISLTKSLGKELAHTGVRVNCVTPGAIRTAILDQWPKDYQEAILAKIPMGRFGLPEELASLVVWLCSQDASFSTGAVFDMSGGRAVY